jgi:hypothetical protein
MMPTGRRTRQEGEAMSFAEYVKGVNDEVFSEFPLDTAYRRKVPVRHRGDHFRTPSGIESEAGRAMS